MAANQTVTVFGSEPVRYFNQTVVSTRKPRYGLAFPLGKSTLGGFFSKSEGIQLIKGAVQQLLLTDRGERVMLPNFGCNLKKYLFQQLNEGLFEEIKREIQQSFYQYIVGASLVKVGVFPTGDAGPLGGNSLRVVLSLKLNVADLEVFDVEVIIT